ncbi:uncharacterized protein LOC126737286 isoform X2 [Anthonomus grandis grandis]|uniref:uncharacterized protein LOC126737286 isoform X2 n=1 Tax=Anthonomus grandis grandis TaxID=2921223 RepID=UPI0021668B0A|nr:uncharacterized protein LOC126737286 isoform X2 [Anthonomus grandis grandis]
MSEIEAELTRILTKIAEAKCIKHYKAVADTVADIGNGFLSSFYKGEIHNQDTGEIISVGIKMEPPFAGINFAKFYKNEEVFYKDFLPAILTLQAKTNMKDPFDNTATYFNSETGNINFIALENVSDKGYKLHDKMAYLNRECLEKIFKIYGKFHALSFVLRRRNWELYEKIHNQYSSDMFQYFVKPEKNAIILKKSITAAYESLDHDSKVYNELEALSENCVKLYIKASEYRGKYWCSTHGDCWSNNMLFKYSDNGQVEDIKLIDFQLARDGSPIHDLAYFFYSGAAKEDLYRIDEYLKIYHETFSNILKALGEDPEELFPFEALLNEWKENALLGVFLGIYLWQVKLLPKEKYQNIFNNPADEKKPNAEEWNEIFAKLLQKTLEGDKFRERAKNILTQAFEYGIISKEKIDAL